MTTNRTIDEEKKSARGAKKAQRARGRQLSAAADLEKLDWRRVMALTVTMADHDGAVRIGRTRDGGAIALGMYRGDDYATEYIRPTEDAAKALDDIAVAWLDDVIKEYWDRCMAYGVT